MSRQAIAPSVGHVNSRQRARYRRICEASCDLLCSAQLSTAGIPQALELWRWLTNRCPHRIRLSFAFQLDVQVYSLGIPREVDRLPYRRSAEEPSHEVIGVQPECAQ